MEYVEVRPPPSLGAYVRCFWFLRAGAADAGHVDRVFPDGTVELVLHLGDPFQELSAKSVRLQPLGLFVGQMTSPVSLAATGRADVVGIRFLPGGAAAFVPPPLEAWRNRIVDLEDVWGPGVAEVRERLQGAESLPARFDLLVGVLEARLARMRQRGSADRIRVAADWLFRRNGRASVADVAQVVGLSTRQLERGFRSYVGVGPKMLSRILRFQHGLRAFETGGTRDWAAAAAETGYYDQSHLIRDFRQFTGSTPGDYAACAHPLNDCFAGVGPGAEASLFSKSASEGSPSMPG